MARTRSPKDLLAHSAYFTDDKTGIQVRAWLAGVGGGGIWLQRGEEFLVLVPEGLECPKVHC